MFAAHPDVFVPLRETGAFKKPLLARHRYRALRREAEASHRSFLVEKTPRHVHHVDLIRRMVPGARFIMPVRDGRDVVASIARRSGSVQAGIDRWVRDTGAILEQRDRDDVFTYRHEDLIEDTRGIVMAVCSFAGIPFDETMLNYHQTERLWFGQQKLVDADPHEQHKLHRTWQINQPVFDNRGRWLDELTLEQVQPLLDGPGRHLMLAFGYLPEPPLSGDAQ